MFRNRLPKPPFDNMPKIASRHEWERGAIQVTEAAQEAYDLQKFASLEDSMQAWSEVATVEDFLDKTVEASVSRQKVALGGLRSLLCHAESFGTLNEPFIETTIVGPTEISDASNLIALTQRRMKIWGDYRMVSGSRHQFALGLTENIQPWRENYEKSHAAQMHAEHYSNLSPEEIRRSWRGNSGETVRSIAEASARRVLIEAFAERFHGLAEDHFVGAIKDSDKRDHKRQQLEIAGGTLTGATLTALAEHECALQFPVSAVVALCGLGAAIWNGQRYLKGFEDVQERSLTIGERVMSDLSNEIKKAYLPPPLHEL